MGEDQAVFVPAYRDEPSRRGVFSAFDPGVRVLPAGFQALPRFKPLSVDIVFEKDVQVTLRDGVQIYVDVFRPAEAGPTPVLVAWSPYGKSRGNASQYTELFDMLGMDTSSLSGLMKFEGPDPAYWCSHGYAVCNPDPRGSYHSDGDIRVWSRREGEDYHDLIEWLGIQDWCNGKVGLTGNSYLAISQWFAAAERPPHLAAIAPWEGMSDIYRDLVKRGGIPDYAFPRRLATSFVGRNRREDLVLEAQRHPLIDELWESKIPAFEDVTVPAYIVASYSNTIHTPGTFRGWRDIGSKDKWLRIHNTMEWPDYYDAANLDDLKGFFDAFLKDMENGWHETPRVRYALMDLEGGDLLNQPADAFPPQGFIPTEFHLDPVSGKLVDEPLLRECVAEYDAESDAGLLSFTVKMEGETEFVGYPRLSLAMEADGSDDMDVFFLLQKLDANGQLLEQFNVPNRSPQMDALTRTGAAILKYKGSNGRIRASMRHLDYAKSTVDIPVHSFDRIEKLTPGQVVQLDIDMFPIGVVLRSGQQLRLMIAGRNLLGGAMPGIENVSPENRGIHILHSGGRHFFYLRIPTRSATIHPMRPGKNGSGKTS